jgi:hypothetical protein
MTTMGSLPARRRRLSTVGAVAGISLALLWFGSVRFIAGIDAASARAQRVDKGAALVELLRRTAQERVKTAAQLLSQDPRLQAAVGLAELDRLTVTDLLQDLQKLDPQAVFAVLTPEGRVIAALGAPHLEGLDLSTSSVVKTALSQDAAAIGAWVVNERVVELAASSVRVGDRRAGLLVVGVHLEDEALAAAAEAANVILVLLLQERAVWTSTPVPETAWRTEPTRSLEVNDSARYLVAASSNDDGLFLLLTWVVPLGALLFSTLAFWRGGGA